MNGVLNFGKDWGLRTSRYTCGLIFIELSLSFFLFLLLSHVIATCVRMCVKAQTYGNKGNYVPLYKFNRREAKSLQVPFRLLKLQVIWDSSTTLKRYHSVIYEKYGGPHQSTTKTWRRPQEKERKKCPSKKSEHFLWRLSKCLLPAYSVLFAVFFFFIISLFFCRHFKGFAFLLPFFLLGARAAWTCRCVLSMTVAATKTAMLRTAGQRPAWTRRSHLW